MVVQENTSDKNEMPEARRRVDCRRRLPRGNAVLPHCRRPLRRTLIPSLAMLSAFAVSGYPLRAQGTTQTRIDTIRLSLADARALALRANQELRASRFDIDIARGELRQAGLLMRANPETDVRAGGEGAEFGVGQEIEIARQRSARRAAATAGLERATASVTNVARTALGDVDRTFYGFVASDRRMLLAEEFLALNQRLAEASDRRLQAGQISRLEFNLAIVEFGRSRARAIAARRARAEVVAELQQLLGLEPTTAIVPVVDSTLVPLAAEATSVGAVPALVPAPALSAITAVEGRRPALALDSLITLALSRRPDLVARSAAVREATAQVSVARRDAFPNLLLRAASEPLEDGSREFRPGLGLTVPAFNRNQGQVQARRAATTQAEIERVTLMLRVRSEVSRAVASYESAAEETNVLETTVLAPARENRRLLEIAFREGKVGLPVLLLIRNQVIDAELEYWDAWLAEREALADLAEAIGETVVGFDPRTPR